MPSKRNGVPEVAGSNTGPQEQGGLTDVVNTVKEKAQDLASAVASKAEDAWDSTRQAASAVRDTTADVWGDLTGFMCRHPLATLFFGMGVGFCLSRVIEGRSMRTFGHWDFGREAGNQYRGMAPSQQQYGQI